MTMISDRRIRELCEDMDIDHEHSDRVGHLVYHPPMISPFVGESVRVRKAKTGYDDGQQVHADKMKVISYGLSSFGYDVRLANIFKIFTNVSNALIDPKNLDNRAHVDHEGDDCIIPPNSYVLGHTVETFNIPENVTAICVGKSTYARAGVIINVTPIEAGFRGQVVIEIANATTLPVKVYANEGIAQLLFFESQDRCETSYADRCGKYQDQKGITLPKV